VTETHSTDGDDRETIALVDDRAGPVGAPFAPQALVMAVGSTSIRTVQEPLRLP